VLLFILPVPDAQDRSTVRLTIVAYGGILNRMVERSPEHLDRIFHALADRTRRAMLRDMQAGERTVSQLAAPHAMSLAAASKHVRVLEHAGLLSRTIDGRTHRCRLEADAMRDAAAFIRDYEAFWNAGLDRLASLFAAEEGA
jgi:DNA-binding transcriptional ArsR family regulator